MKITLQKIKIKDLYDGFVDRSEEGEGIVAYHGLLNVQPKYQREFIYDDERQKKVINSILQAFPLSVMYWVKTDETHYEMLDGQQRTVSICRFVSDVFSVEKVDKTKTSKSLTSSFYFSNLSQEEKDTILNYELYVYICEGKEEETLDWFRTINISGVALTEQEMLNAIYSGPFVESLKKYFSRGKCAFLYLKVGENNPLDSTLLVNGNRLRQDYVATSLRRYAMSLDTTVVDVLSRHKKEGGTSFVYDYVVSVLKWVVTLFGEKENYRKEMKGVDWGYLYDFARRHRQDLFNPSEETKVSIRKEVTRLMSDVDVTSKRGVYDYVVTGRESSLSLRTFDEATKRTVYERQGGVCLKCGRHFDIDDMDADHILPWSKGGRTTIDNCQMLCKSCNRKKSDY